MNIPHIRLTNQHLLQHDLDAPQEVVSWLGAVQAQDYAMAKWGVGLRMKQATDVSVEKAYDEGKIIRTHVMRPTWHFVLPEDLRWMQELTAHRVKKLMGHYNRKLALTDQEFKTCNSIIERALQGGNYLTRAELAEELERHKIAARGQRLGHIVMNAELDALICSGPRRGKQFTYALIEDRVPKAKKISKEEGLAKITEMYFQSHGPAQLKDFSWWSGLSIKEAQEGLDSIKSKLKSETINNKIYWFYQNKPTTYNVQPTTYLLSIFDEYTIAYTDRSDISDKRDIERMISMGNALLNVLILDGRVAGTWKRTIKKQMVEVDIKPFRKLTNDEQKIVQKEAERLGEFLGLSAVVTL